MKPGFIILPLLVTLASAQQTPVFRSTTTVVPITVTVLDRNGAPVKDLKQSDFTVLENKSPREILNFFPQEFTPGPVPADPEAAVKRRGVGGGPLAPQTRRTFLIVLGYGRIQHPTNALDGAMEFVRKRLLPQDAVAVMGFHRATNFTTEHEQIAQILERYKKAHEKIVFDINEFRVMSRAPTGMMQGINGLGAPPLTGAGGAPIPDRILKVIDEVFTGPPVEPQPGPAVSAPLVRLRHTTDMLLGMDRVLQVVDKPGQRQETFAEIAQAAREQGDELRDNVLLSSRLKMYAGIEYLRYLEGEKHMLFLGGSGDGGLARNADDAQIVAKRATDARVVVDFVATNGTNPPGRGGAGGGGGGGSPNSRIVSELTGGYYTSVEMAAKAVAKIDQATRFSYLLGYAPVSQTLDGRYRDVEVKVNRGDVTVRYNHGYFASAEPPPLELKELVIKSRVEAALSYDSNAKDIPLTVKATLLPRLGVRGQVNVEVIVGAAPLGLTLKDGIRTGQIELQIYCGDAREQIVCDFGERLDLSAGDALYDDWLKNGIRRLARVPLFEDPKYLKVVVYDYGSDRVGSFMLKLK